jgi:glycosyltransferase involved in cell wall biosynthesis
MPQFSILIATYNRSEVLRCAIESVLHQTILDWELWVIGDACTDDSAEVVASFSDPRIHWHNLPENSGSQGVPNAFGARQAAAPYLCHLGHDDLWHPRHLEHLLRAIHETHADFLHTLALQLGTPETGIRSLQGLPPRSSDQIDGRITPSCVCYRRSLIERAGTWRDYREIAHPPDRDFFERVFALGIKRVAVEELTVYRFAAFWRPGVYQRRDDSEQRHYLERMRTETDFLYREALRTAVAYGLGKIAPPGQAVRTRARRGAEIEERRRVRGLEARSLPPMTTADLQRAAKMQMRRYLPAIKDWILRPLPAKLRSQVLGLKRKLIKQ